jgi:hydroxyethylthiazole kinase
VTGGGCALGAVMAAFLGAGARPLDAAVSASAVWGLAAERAAAASSGPGSFAVGLLDALAALQPADAEAGARIA